MIWLIMGVVVWSFMHFIPAVARSQRENMIAKLGPGAYRGVFSLVILLSVAMMVYGWRGIPEVYLYQLPSWSRPVGMILMLIAFILLGASHNKTVIKRFFRHPMLTGMLLWSVGHLITNGTTRALVLFGGLGLWAIVQIVLTNARDGHYEKPQAPAFSTEIKGLAISVVIFCVVLFLHPYFTGVSVIP